MTFLFNERHYGCPDIIVTGIEKYLVWHTTNVGESNGFLLVGANASLGVWGGASSGVQEYNLGSWGQEAKPAESDILAIFTQILL
jgi:hypothetical protein